MSNKHANNKVFKYQSPFKKEAKPIDPERELEDTIAEFCLYYPQYKFKEALEEVPEKRVRQMLLRARQLEAQRYYHQAYIQSMSTQNGKYAQEIINHYFDQAHG